MHGGGALRLCSGATDLGYTAVLSAVSATAAACDALSSALDEGIEERSWSAEASQILAALICASRRRAAAPAATAAADLKL